MLKIKNTNMALQIIVHPLMSRMAVLVILLGWKLTNKYDFELGLPKLTFTKLSQLILAWQKNAQTNNAYNSILHNSYSMHNNVK